MDTKRIIGFLRQVTKNNNRPWFQEHKSEYETVRADIAEGVQHAIRQIATFDSSIAHLQVKDCTYRFYRDTRFSADKSPYKNHLGAYMSAYGKKSLHGGYYMHIEPDHCMVACGNYWLPTNILTSCRNEIMSNTEEWLKCVKDKEFLKYFGNSAACNTDVSNWDTPQGFGLERLKTCPAGFPRDWAYIDYLRQKDYCCWHRVPDDFFDGDQWLEEMERMYRAAKPMMDFMNEVIDDYE